MNYIKESVTAFRAYASALLKEQAIEIKKITHSPQISGKLAQLRAANALLEIFREQLSREVTSILAEAKFKLRPEEYALLAAELKTSREDNINEFLWISYTSRK